MILMDSCGFVWGHWSSSDTITWSLGLVAKSQYWMSLWIPQVFFFCCYLLNNIRRTKWGLGIFGPDWVSETWWEEEMGRSLLHRKLARLPVTCMGDVLCHCLWQVKSFWIVLKWWDGKNCRDSAPPSLHLLWPKVSNSLADLWFALGGAGRKCP